MCLRGRRACLACTKAWVLSPGQHKNMKEKKKEKEGKKEEEKERDSQGENAELQKTLEVGWAPGGGWLGLEGGASSLNTRFCLPRFVRGLAFLPRAE